MLCLQGFSFFKNPLWKTLVDKPVENVEKFRFSTAISGFSNGPSRKNPADLWINSLSFGTPAVLRQATLCPAVGCFFAEKVLFP
jgi:hypothetical protein